MTGAGGDDDGLGSQRLPIHGQAKGLAGQVHRLDAAESDLRAEALGLFLEARHEFVAIDAFREPGVVLDHRGGGQQAAWLPASQDERAQVGAGGIQGGRQPSAA